MAVNFRYLNIKDTFVLISQHLCSNPMTLADRCMVGYLSCCGVNLMRRILLGVVVTTSGIAHLFLNSLHALIFLNSNRDTNKNKC